MIGTLFKLYPWEDMLADPFADAIPGAHCRFIEPAWKALVSNKGILPVLWRLFEGHPNLLPAFFEDELATGRGRDACAGGARPRPGHQADLLAGGRLDPHRGARARAPCRRRTRAMTHHPKIVQAYQPLPTMGGMHPVLGAWIVGDTCVGLGIREDASRDHAEPVPLQAALRAELSIAARTLYSPSRSRTSS